MVTVEMRKVGDDYIVLSKVGSECLLLRKEDCDCVKFICVVAV